MTDRAVTPRALVVSPGDPVVWRNAGHNRHTVTADRRAFDSGPLLPGERFRIAAPATPGVHGYRCVFHPFIRGTLTVSPVRVAAPAAVDAGRRATLRGRAPRSAAGTRARAERRVPGAWVPAGTSVVGPAGGFVLRLGPITRSVAVRVSVGANVSPSVRVAVRPRVTVRLRGTALTVRVHPASSVVARLERRERGRWRRVGARRLARGRAAFALPAPGDYRVAIAPAAGLAGRVSRVVRLP